MRAHAHGSSRSCHNIIKRDEGKLGDRKGRVRMRERERWTDRICSGKHVRLGYAVRVCSELCDQREGGGRGLGLKDTKDNANGGYIEDGG